MICVSVYFSQCFIQFQYIARQWKIWYLYSKGKCNNRDIYLNTQADHHKSMINLSDIFYDRPEPDTILTPCSKCNVFIHWVPLTTSKKMQKKLLVVGARELFNMIVNCFDAKQSARYSRVFIVTELILSGTQCTWRSLFSAQEKGTVCIWLWFCVYWMWTIFSLALLLG